MTCILVVDDNPSICQLMQASLAAADHCVCIARAGALALQDVRWCSYDLLITDLNMPEVSGFDVALTARAVHPSVPVLGMTGDMVDARQAATFDGLLRKPFSIADARAMVHELLGAALTVTRARMPDDPVPMQQSDFVAGLTAGEAELLAYWQSKHDGQMVPPREAIDPNDVRNRLPHLQLYQRMADGRFRCRLSGTAITSIIGFDPTGKYTEELPLRAGWRGSLFERVTAAARPVYYRARVTFPGQDWRTIRRLMVPLRYLGDEVNMILSHVESGATILAGANHAIQDLELLESRQLVEDLRPRTHLSPARPHDAGSGARS